MAVQTTITDATQPLPPFDFHWDVETEILAGRHPVEATGDGFTVTWELESPTGAVVVLETEGGVLCGIEVVVWPDVDRVPQLVAPHGVATARVGLVPPEGAAGLIEIETPIGAEATASETLIHVRFGVAGAQTVRVAENLLVSVDEVGHLAGLWLLDLPLFPSGG
jgi:hypothetical protein